MKNTFLIFAILLSLLPFTFSKCSSNDDCSDHGYCSKSNKCQCFSGYFEDDCSKSLLDVNRSGVIIVQIAFSVLFALLTSLSTYAFYRSIAKAEIGQTLATNIRAFVFAAYALMMFTQFLYVAIDPMMVWETTPYVVVTLFNTFSYPLGIIAFLGILFHWIDLINTSVETLKKEEMMQKINKFYKGKDITLEDMVEKVQFLRKLRVPFVVTGVLVFVLIMTVNIMKGLMFKPEVVGEITGPIILAAYAILCFGFLYYGRKLSKLIPYQLTKKVQKLTRRLSAYCLTVIFIVAILITVLRTVPVGRSPNFAFINFCVVEACVAALEFGAISIFLSWQKKFPFITFSADTSSSTVSTTPSGHTTNFDDTSILEQDSEL